MGSDFRCGLRNEANHGGSFLLQLRLSYKAARVSGVICKSKSELNVNERKLSLQIN